MRRWITLGVVAAALNVGSVQGEAILSVGSITLAPDATGSVVVSGNIAGESTFAYTIIVTLVPQAGTTGTVAFTPAPPADITQVGDSWPGVGTFDGFDTDNGGSATLNASVDDNGTFLPGPTTYVGPLTDFPIQVSGDAAGVWDVLLTSEIFGESSWAGLPTTLITGTITIEAAACPGSGNGDTNGDLSVDGRDISLFVQQMLSPTGAPDAAFCASDLDGNNDVNPADVPLMVRALMGTGACCVAGGACQNDRTRDECESGGGVYGGDGSDCGTVTCPTGACCAADGVCTPDVTLGECDAANGTYQGNGTDCSITCPVLPLNDECDAAEAILGTGTFPFDNTEGTGGVVGVCSMGRDVWFCWTANADGLARIETCGQTSVDTKIAVYNDCGACPPAFDDLVVCGDDECGNQSSVLVEAVIGQSFLIRLGAALAQPGGTGNIVITSLGYSGSVDDCDDAPSSAAISGAGTFFFDNSAATSVGPDHAGCDFSGEAGIDRDVWFCWTAPCDGIVTVETCNLTTSDSKIAAYSNACGAPCPPTDGDLLDCDDDTCDQLRSVISFPATSGTTYLLRIGTFPNAQSQGGAFTITIGCS